MARIDGDCVRAETCGVLDELLALASPRSGLAVVVLGEVDSAGLRATVDAAGEIELDPLGLRLVSIGVSHEAAANTAVLLDAAAEHLTVEASTPTQTSRRKPIPESPSASSAVVDEVIELTGPRLDLAAAGELLGGEDEDEEASEEPALLVGCSVHRGWSLHRRSSRARPGVHGVHGLRGRPIDGQRGP